MTTSQEKLVTDNMRLAYHIALKGPYKPTTVCPTDELVHIALEGLCKAAAGYDPDKGVKFATYAARVIHNTICRELDIIRMHYPRAVNLSSDLMPQEGYYDDGYDEVEWESVRRDVETAKKKVLKKQSVEKQTIYRLWLEHGNGSTIAEWLHFSKAYTNAKIREINAAIRAEYARMVSA